MSAAIPQANPFAGYGRPKYTQIPNLFIDEQMQDLTESEIKCMLYIFRRTFGYHEDGAEIQLSHFVVGWFAADGRRLDYGAGVAERSLSPALKNLEQRRGFIFRHQQQTTKKGSTPTYYELNIDGVPHCTDNCRANCSAAALAGDPPSAKLAYPPSAKLADPPTGKDCIPPVGKICPPLSTIERKNRKRKNPPPTPSAHIPPVAPSPVVEVVEVSERVKTDTALLVTFGLDEETARECALVAERNGRLGGYVSDNIAYVQFSPSVKDPAAVLVANIRKNRHHKPPAQAAPPALVLVPTPDRIEPADTPAPALLTLPTAPSITTTIWNQARPYLKNLCPGEWEKTLRYVQLADLDPTNGTALLTVPNDHLRRAVERLADSISLALHQAGQPALRILVAIQQTDSARPTLAGDSPVRNTQ